MKTEALETFDLEGTPTFYVNGKQLTGDKTLEQLAAEIDPLVPAGLRSRRRRQSQCHGRRAAWRRADAPAANMMAAEPVAPAAPASSKAFTAPVFPGTARLPGVLRFRYGLATSLWIGRE